MRMFYVFEIIRLVYGFFRLYTPGDLDSLDIINFGQDDIHYLYAICANDSTKDITSFEIRRRATKN